AALELLPVDRDANAGAEVVALLNEHRRLPAGYWPPGRRPSTRAPWRPPWSYSRGHLLPGPRPTGYRGGGEALIISWNVGVTNFESMAYSLKGDEEPPVSSRAALSGSTRHRSRCRIQLRSNGFRARDVTSCSEDRRRSAVHHENASDSGVRANLCKARSTGFTFHPQGLCGQLCG